jgi:cell wall-associated NlpC family hydrolase
MKLTLKKRLTAIFLFTSLTVAHANNITLPLELPQDAFEYFAPATLQDPLLSSENQAHNLAYFKKQYFYPWSNRAQQQLFCYVPGIESTCDTIQDLESGTLDFYQSQSGYDENYQPHRADWLTPIRDNMDLNHFPNMACNSSASCPGIMVDNAQVRSLPTHTAFYSDFTLPGEGYPFDYVQLSEMWLATPVQLIHMTQDKQWTLVNGQGILGWVPTTSVAHVDSEFIKRWQGADFVTPSVQKQNFTAAPQLGIKQIQLYLGTILPKKGNTLWFPAKKANGKTAILEIKASHLALVDWPLLPTASHFASQINALSGMPYGWGGKDFHSDCSGLMRRLFLSFGMWLPRSTYWQTHFTGDHYNLFNQTVEQRKKFLMEGNAAIKPPPFFTLISIGSSENSTSHIGLYLGTTGEPNEKMAIMFHTPWGVKIHNEIETGRALVAQSLISPVGMGDALSSGLLSKNWQVDSLWDKVGMHVIVLAPGSSSASHDFPSYRAPALSQDTDKITRYLLEK